MDDFTDVLAVFELRALQAEEREVQRTITLLPEFEEIEGELDG